MSFPASKSLAVRRTVHVECSDTPQNYNVGGEEMDSRVAGIVGKNLKSGISECWKRKKMSLGV